MIPKMTADTLNDTVTILAENSFLQHRQYRLRQIDIGKRGSDQSKNSLLSEHLQSYLDEYVFRFNRRNSRNIGKKFMRIAQQVNSSTKTTYKEIIGGNSPYCLLAN